MSGHRVRNNVPMPWSDDNERIFIDILYERVKANALQCSTFTRDEWGRINENMKVSTKMDYGIERLKGKWNRLRKMHRMFSVLLGHTGVTWDPITNNVNAPEKVWEHYYTINKSEYKLLRKEGCKHYHTLGEIFSGTTATGGLGAASTQLPNISDEERQMEDDFLNRGVHVRVENDDDLHEISPTRPRDETGTSGGSRRRQPRTRKTDKLETCMAQWSENVSSRNEETEIRKQYFKEKLAVLQGKSSAQSVHEVNSLDPYSTKCCMTILNRMDGLPDEAYVKAIMSFKNSEFRVSFVEMPEARRGNVLMLL